MATRIDLQAMGDTDPRDTARDRGRAAREALDERGPESPPPSGDEDEVLLERLGKRPREVGALEDMVVSSASGWDEELIVPPPRRAGRSPEPRAARAAGPRTPTRSRRGLLIGVAALGAAGLATTVVVFALTGSSPPAEHRAAEPIAIAPDAEAGREGAPGSSASPGAAAGAGSDTDRERAGAESGSDRAGASTSTSDSAKPPTPPRPPSWVLAVERLNPWVAVAPAGGRVLLGLSREALADPKARSALTGFHPNKGVNAPTTRYAMQRHEVTWGELERYIGATGAGFDVTFPGWVPKTAEARARLPAAGIPWELASAYCQAIGGALPSEAEWEWAARGAALRTFPWGEDLPFATRVQIRRGSPIPLAEVGTRDQDRTPEGIHDLLGNAREWTRDRWTANRLGGVDAQPGEALYRAVRGWPLGAPGSSIPTEGVTMRHAVCASGECPAKSNELVGFRCVKPL